MTLEGKIAIVTGAGMGMGRTDAILLAKEGASVVVADIDLESAENVVAEIKSLGRQAQAVKVDVSSREEVNQMVQKALDTFGRIDILVNNAAVARLVPADELSDADWNSTIDVNLKGVFLCCQAVGRQMIKQGHGKIINIASVSAHRGVPTQVAYAASKGGVLALTRQLAVEWAPFNINVNSISPGTTATPMLMKALENRRQSIQHQTRWIPLSRANKPEDIASAVLFLASPESDNITGQDILIDGGITALYWPKGEVVQTRVPPP